MTTLSNKSLQDLQSDYQRLLSRSEAYHKENNKTNGDAFKNAALKVKAEIDSRTSSAPQKKNDDSPSSEQTVEPEREEEVPVQQKGSLLGGLKAMVDYAKSNNPQNVEEVIQIGKKAAGLDEKK